MKAKERQKIEAEVVQMLAEGLTASQIGEKKKWTPRKVQEIISQTRAAYGADNTPHLIAIAFRKKIIQ